MRKKEVKRENDRIFRFCDIAESHVSTLHGQHVPVRAECSLTSTCALLRATNPCFGHQNSAVANSNQESGVALAGQFNSILKKSPAGSSHSVQTTAAVYDSPYWASGLSTRALLRPSFSTFKTWPLACITVIFLIADGSSPIAQAILPSAPDPPIFFQHFDRRLKIQCSALATVPISHTLTVSAQ